MERVDREGEIATARTLARILSSVPPCRHTASYTSTLCMHASKHSDRLCPYWNRQEQTPGCRSRRHPTKSARTRESERTRASALRSTYVCARTCARACEEYMHTRARAQERQRRQGSCVCSRARSRARAFLFVCFRLCLRLCALRCLCARVCVRLFSFVVVCVRAAGAARWTWSSTTSTRCRSASTSAIT